MSRSENSIIQSRMSLDFNETEIQINPTPTTKKVFGSFAKGLILGLDPEVLPEDACSALNDTYVNAAGRLTKTPGITISETLIHEPQKSFIHTSLDKTSELVMISAPYMGVKGTGNTTWYDLALNVAAKDWNGAMYADVLLISNGSDTVYSRQTGGTTLTPINNMPAGKTVAVFNARVIVGNATIAGIYEPMGIAWNDDTGLFDQWGVGTGSGNELLIYDFSETDYIVTMKAMSLDLLAILCRHSVWIGARTSDPNRPVDPSPRITGNGCVNAATAQLIPGGLMYLSDTGVLLFDGNATVIASEAINAQLLPLGNDDGYSASYNKTKGEYKLYTPECTWTYSFEFERWHRSSETIDEAFDFPQQTAQLTWATALNTWEDYDTEAWRDVSSFQGQSRMMYRQGSNLGLEGSLTQNDFSTGVSPVWNSPITTAEELDTVITTEAVRIRYIGSGDVTIQLVDMDGNFEDVITKTLPVASKSKTVDIGMLHSGIAYGVGLKLLSGNIEIMRVQTESTEQNTKIAGL